MLANLWMDGSLKNGRFEVKRSEDARTADESHTVRLAERGKAFYLPKRLPATSAWTFVSGS